MDCQFVCNPQGIACYTTSAYITKADIPDMNMIHKKILRGLASDNGLENNLRRNLYLAGISVIASTQISMQEAAWHLLGFELVKCSRGFVTINALPQEQQAYYKMRNFRQNKHLRKQVEQKKRWQ